MARKATSVTREDGEYVAESPDDEPLGRAGALSFKGETLALSDGSSIHFPEAVWQVDDLAFKDGLLIIE